jgi:hypothetical protein
MRQLSFDKVDYALVGLVAFFTLLRLVVSPTFGLGVDEAHYFLYAKHLDISYVDHPPLVGWVHAPLYWLFGTNEFLVRLPAILLSVFVSIFCYRFATAFSGSKIVALLAVLAVNSSFMLNAMSLMLLPDCFLLVLIFPLIVVILRIEENGHLKYFVYLGLILGLAGLAKYTAVLFIVPLIVYFILKKRYDLLYSPLMFLAAVIALVLISPVLYWNYHHDWISFRYQGGHVLGTSTAGAKSFFVSLLAQFGAYSPFLFITAFYGFLKSLTAKNDRLRLSCLFGGTLLIFFLYSSLYERTLPHWPSLFYLLFIPVGVYYLWAGNSRAKKKFLFFSVGFSLTLTLFLYAELSAKWFAFPDYKSPFRDIYGFTDITRQASALMEKNSNPRKALAVTNWTMGSRIMYYSLPFGMKTFVIDRRKDQFDIWEKDPPAGYDLLFVGTHFHPADIARTAHCDSTEAVKSMDILLNGAKVDSIDYIWCRNYRGFKP